MVSVAGAPLRFGGGHLRTTRVVPARLRFKGGNVSSGNDTATGAGLGVLNLDRLTYADQVPGQSADAFMRWVSIWQNNCTAIEDAFAAIDGRVDEIERILARLTAAEALAQTANDNAAAAAATVAVVQEAVSETFREIDTTYGGIFDERVNQQ